MVEVYIKQCVKVALKRDEILGDDAAGQRYWPATNGFSTKRRLRDLPNLLF
jgi:hypothetical protein